MVVGVDQAWDDHPVRQADNLISSGILLRQHLGAAYPLDDIPSHKDSPIVQLPVKVAEGCKLENVLQCQHVTKILTSSVLTPVPA